MTKIHQALSDLHRDIAQGGEFPEAAYRCAGRYGVNQSELEKLYDIACEEGIEHTCPKCGGHTFKVSITRTVEIEFLTDEDHDLGDESADTEFDDESSAECMGCAYFSALGDMK